jgi:hypothetical protein
MWTTIGARLLNLFFRNLVCMSAFYNVYALVGCGWNNGSAGGLWCWNFTELSSAYGVVGARLLSLIMGLDVYEYWLAMSFALVGGMFWDTLTCGLWYWALDHTSSYVYSDTGARLIIWELMCKSLIVYLYSCRRCL